jgi:hypothetical protein
MKDYVYRRVVVEYGRLYVYAYFTDDNGKLLDEESFKQPYLLDRKDVSEEAQEMFDLCYQHLLDTVAPSASRHEDDGQSGEEDPKP